MANIELGESVMASERRVADRKKLIIDVRFEDGEGTGIANTRDIGVGGLYMTTTADLDTGTPIMMAVRIGGETMNLKGVVVYADPGHGVGVRFKDMSPSEEELLHKELAAI